MLSTLHVPRCADHRGSHNLRTGGCCGLAGAGPDQELQAARGAAHQGAAGAMRGAGRACGAGCGKAEWMGPVVVKVCMQGSVLLARRRRPPALRRLSQLPPPQPATPPTHTPGAARQGPAAPPGGPPPPPHQPDGPHHPGRPARLLRGAHATGLGHAGRRGPLRNWIEMKRRRQVVEQWALQRETPRYQLAAVGARNPMGVGIL